MRTACLCSVAINFRPWGTCLLRSLSAQGKVTLLRFQVWPLGDAVASDADGMREGDSLTLRQRVFAGCSRLLSTQSGIALCAIQYHGELYTLCHPQSPRTRLQTLCSPWRRL